MKKEKQRNEYSLATVYNPQGNTERGREREGGRERGRKRQGGNENEF